MEWRHKPLFCFMKARLLKRLRGDSFFDIMSCHFHYYIMKVEDDRYLLGERYAHINLPIFYGNFKEVYKKLDRILRDDKRRKVMRRIKKWRIVYGILRKSNRHSGIKE